MNMNHGEITEQEFQAFIDDELDTERRSAVEKYLNQHPEKAAELADYQSYNDGLHKLFDPILNEPIPDQLNLEKPLTKPLIPWAQAASLVLAIAIGSVIGWVSHDTINQQNESEIAQSTELQTSNIQAAKLMVNDAFAYHAVYTPEILHPVEVTADKQEHLVKWLSKRLKTPIKAPDLSEQGFQLLGGRLLETGNLPAAQFMYENKQGTRLTLLTRHKKSKEQLSSFRYETEGNINGFYWVDDQQSFVLLSESSKNELSNLAHKVYQTYNSDII